MQKKDFIFYLSLTLLVILGVWVGGFGGGFLAGVCSALVLLVAIGRKAANKAATAIDKRVKDMIVQSQMEKEQ